MKISRKTDYAIMVLAYFASRGIKSNKTYSNVKDIAAKCGISIVFTHKLISTMVSAGWLESKRGRGGGVRLIRDPKSINMADIITTLEGPLEITVCSSKSNEDCYLQDKCVLYGRWQPVNRAVFAALSKVKLQDLMVTHYQ